MFASKGFDATTIEEIADAVEVSPRTFFRYFASKEEVLFAEDAGRDGDLAEFLAARPAGESSLEKLRAALLGWTADYELDRQRLMRRAQDCDRYPEPECRRPRSLASQRGRRAGRPSRR